MKKADLRAGMDVAVMQDGRTVRATVVEIDAHPQGHLCEIDGTTTIVPSRLIKSSWEEYTDTEWRDRLRTEVQTQMQQKAIENKTQELDLLRDVLNLSGIETAVGSVYVPNSGHELALIVRYEQALKLKAVIAAHTIQKFKGTDEKERHQDENDT